MVYTKTSKENKILRYSLRRATVALVLFLKGIAAVLTIAATVARCWSYSSVRGAKGSELAFCSTLIQTN